MVISSTIDKIKDTTIMRQIRKLAGVIDEQNASIEAVNDKLDNFDISGVETDIASLKTNVANLDKTVDQVEISVTENTEHLTTVDSTLDNHARNIKANTDAINTLEPNVEALNKELPTEFTLYRTGSGKIQLQCEREDSTVLDSNILDMIIPESYNIVSGTTNRSFKLSVAFSDGTTAETNDFVIPEGGGTDVTVTGIALIKLTDNTFKTCLNLSDGTPINSGALKTVNSVAGAFANNKLTITVNGVSSTPITIDTAGTVYTQGNGIKIANGTISIDTTVVALKTDISDMETKTEANTKFATKTEFNSLKGSVGDAIKPIDIVEASNGLSVEMESLDGQKNSVLIPLAEDSSFGLIDNNRFLTAGYLLGGWNRSYFTYEEDSESEGFIYPSVDNTTIHYNDSNQLEVIGGGSSTSNDINLIRGSFDKNFPLTVTYNEQANLSVTKAYPFNTAYGGGDYILNSFVYSTSGGLKAKDVDFRILGSDRTVSSTSETDTFYVTGNWNDDLMVSVAERITAMLSNTDVGVGGSNLIKIRVQLYPISISTEGETTINVYSQTTTSNLWVDVFLDYAGNVIRTDMQTYANQGVTSKIKLLGHTVTVNLCGKVVSISNYTD